MLTWSRRSLIPKCLLHTFSSKSRKVAFHNVWSAPMPQLHLFKILVLLSRWKHALVHLTMIFLKFIHRFWIIRIFYIIRCYQLPVCHGVSKTEQFLLRLDQIKLLFRCHLAGYIETGSSRKFTCLSSLITIFTKDKGKQIKIYIWLILYSRWKKDIYRKKLKFFLLSAVVMFCFNWLLSLSVLAFKVTWVVSSLHIHHLIKNKLCQKHTAFL